MGLKFFGHHSCFLNKTYSETCRKGTPTGPKFLSAAGVRFIEVNFNKKRAFGDKSFVHFKLVSALEHVLFRQVSLYVFVFGFGQPPSVQNIFKITPKSSSIFKVSPNFSPKFHRNW